MYLMQVASYCFLIKDNLFSIYKKKKKKKRKKNHSLYHFFLSKNSLNPNKSKFDLSL